MALRLLAELLKDKEREIVNVKVSFVGVFFLVLLLV